MTDAILDALQASVYPPGLTGAVAADYRPELRELIVELELPRQTIAPSAAAYRYVRARNVIEPVPRKDAEVKEIYARVLARIVLRTLAEALAASPILIVTRVSINGYVSAKDRATGQAVRPCLISVGAAREEVEALELDEPELDPQACLRHLNALVSPHPYELEPVRPLVTFDLSRYRFVDEMNVVAGLDSRPDLTKLPPVEFEHLVRQLFEAMGLKSWVTRSSRDEGVDAVVVNDDPIVGGLCVIQAKRYSKIVGLEAVNALAGVMNDKAAAKGILVTTSWVGQASREFAARNGRMEIIEGRQLRHLLKEHLGVDALIGLDRLPPDWSPDDLGT
jgi:restriction system protein